VVYDSSFAAGGNKNPPQWGIYQPGSGFSGVKRLRFPHVTGARIADGIRSFHRVMQMGHATVAKAIR
jgi:hypothetical protein